MYTNPPQIYKRSHLNDIFKRSKFEENKTAILKSTNGLLIVPAAADGSPFLCKPKKE